MRHHVIFAAIALMTVGCLGGGGGGGAPLDEPVDSPTDEPLCGSPSGVLTGSVYYWGLPGEPDSLPADSVDVFLTNGGPTYRTPTAIDGTFTVELAEGEWSVVADNQTGCLEQNSETVVVTPCETTEVELVIGLCEF